MCRPRAAGTSAAAPVSAAPAGSPRPAPAAAPDIGRLQREALHNASTPNLRVVKDQQIRFSKEGLGSAEALANAAAASEAANVAKELLTLVLDDVLDDMVHRP